MKKNAPNRTPGAKAKAASWLYAFLHSGEKQIFKKNSYKGN